MIYFDNAATTFPKPPEVAKAVCDYMLNIGANPGRGGYRLSADAARIVFNTREALSDLFNIPDSSRVVFTSNATEGINTVLRGMLKPGDHVVVTGMEHNAVMRPLRFLEKTQGVRVAVARSNGTGEVDPEAMGSAVVRETRLVVVNHASNVTGAIAPLSEIRAEIGSLPLLVDAAQTAGAFPIDVEADGIDLLAITGHKSLLGPTGTGALYIRQGLEKEIEPLMRGGTGSRSEDEHQPEMLPDRYESGTRNAAGLAGLGAAVDFISAYGVDKIRRHEMRVMEALLGGLESIDGVTVNGINDPTRQMSTTSITINGLNPSQVGYELDRRYGILVRVGLHCAPAAHVTLGTAPEGTVRLAPGLFTTDEEVKAVIEAVAELAKEGASAS